jgi:imidazolonepropionase-like amidohydrolase
MKQSARLSAGVFLTGLLGVLASAFVNAQGRSGNGGVLIEQVTVVSSHLQAPLVGVDVALENGLIVAIGKGLPAPSNTRRIAGRGKYLIPGLIDSHVHVRGVVGLDDASIEQRPELLQAYRAQQPRAFLAFGFTTLVDLDSTLEERQAFEQTPLHPHLYSCDRAVTIAGGYTAQRLPSDAKEQDFPHLVYEPAQSARWPASLAAAEHTAAKVVERIAARGAICVKVMVERGFGLFDWPVPSRETLSALRTTAHERGLPLVVHASSVDAWNAALDADADVIAHGLWQWGDDRFATEPSEGVRAVIERAARQGARVQPTIQVVQNDRAVLEAGPMFDDARAAWALPPEILTNLRAPDAQAARSSLAAAYNGAATRVGETGGMVALIDRGVGRARTAARLMSDGKVRLIFGSDTPASSGVGIGNPPGLNGRLELQQWAEAGVPPADILRAATLDNADAFGLAREIGTVESGKRADLLLLSANPLERVAAYDSIEMVFLSGEPIERDMLRPNR